MNTLITDNQKLWVAALRSGEYEQGKGSLNPTANSFCCLGVACEISNLGKFERPDTNPARSNYRVNTDDLYEYRKTLPPEVVEWLGLKDDCGCFPTTMLGLSSSLTMLNDFEGLSFNEIADFIERNAEKLFTHPRIKNDEQI
jgi:hypothetical protein